MTKELKSLLERAAQWPQEVQDEAADSLRAIETAYSGLYVLTADDKKALKKSAEDVRLNKFVSKKKLHTFFKSGRA